MKGSRRFIVFLLVNIFSVALIAMLAIGGFMTASEISSVTLVVGEGLSRRTEAILNNTEPTDAANYFTRDFLLHDNTDELRGVYARYRLSGYSYKYTVTNVTCHPWDTETTVTFTEYVTNIDGFLPSENMTEEELAQESVIYPPLWENAEWSVTVRKEAGNWKIDKIERVSLLPMPSDPHNHGPLSTPTPSPTPAPTATPAPTPTPTPALQKGEVVIGSGVLYVRSGPSTDYAQIDSLVDGEIITVLGEENGWYLISIGTRTGYVSSSYVRLITEG